MKICIISNLFEPYITGGAEIVAAELAEKLKTKGLDVFVISTSPCLKSGVTTENIHSLKVYRFYPLNLYWSYESKKKQFFLKPLWHIIDIWNPHSYFIIKNILKQERPDIVHTHNIAGISPAVWSAAKHLHIPVVHTLHDYYPVCSRTTLMSKDGTVCKGLCAGCRFLSFFKKIFSKNINVVVSPSKFVLDILEQYDFFKSTIKRIIPNGIDTAGINRGNVISRREVNFLFVGQIENHKGIELLLKVFSSLPQNNIGLHVIGYGRLFQYLKDFYSRDKRISFYGFLSGKEKEKVFLESDVLIVPSLWYENSPKVIYEAYSFGMPVIGSRIGGIPELIDENKTGFLIDPGDKEALTSIMSRLINNLTMVNDMKDNCIEKSKNLSLDKQVNSYFELYHELLNRGVSL